MTWTAFAILAMFLPTCQTVTFFSTLLWLLSWDVKLAFTITFFENQLEDRRSRARNQKSKSDLMELWLNRSTSKASMQVSRDFYFNKSLNIFGGDLSLADILLWARVGLASKPRFLIPNWFLAFSINPHCVKLQNFLDFFVWGGLNES